MTRTRREQADTAAAQAEDHGIGGLPDGFYSQGMARIESTPSAQLMYAGAIMWLIVAVVALALIQAFRASARSAASQASESQTSNPIIPTLAQELTTLFKTPWVRVESKVASHYMYRSWDTEESPLVRDKGQTYTGYGTLLDKWQNDRVIDLRMVRISLIAAVGLGLVWIAQGMFWMGFVGLGLDW